MIWDVSALGYDGGGGGGEGRTGGGSELPTRKPARLRRPGLAPSVMAELHCRAGRLGPSTNPR